MNSYYRARHILLEDFEDAQEMLDLLEQGNCFEELAQTYSECDSAPKGGNLGKFRSGQMTASFERALYRMSDNEISEPIKTEYGFHIIQKLKLD